jgi:cytochrome c oxidase subunit 3
MSIMASEQRNKIHPHKFTLWVALGSIVMMFAGLTSAYIVKRSQPGWTTFQMPLVFWYSSAVMLLSSLTIQMAVRSFKEREMAKYRGLMAITAVLGVLFIGLQIAGFSQLWSQGIQLRGSGAGQFLYIIFGLHGFHVLGGIIALAVVLVKAFLGNRRNYNSVPVEIAATYWHFVDLLWIYLFVFFLWMQ